MGINLEGLGLHNVFSFQTKSETSSTRQLFQSPTSASLTLENTNNDFSIKTKLNSLNQFDLVVSASNPSDGPGPGESPIGGPRAPPALGRATPPALDAVDIATSLRQSQPDDLMIACH